MIIEWVPAPTWMKSAQRAAQKRWPYANHPQYTDDLLAAVVRATERAFYICWVPYSLKWAIDRNLLKTNPPLHTLSVSSIVTAQDRVLIGKRSSNLLSFPNRWEFAPAGGVGQCSLQGDQICLTKQILEEWREEICPSTDSIDSICEVDWLYCPGTRTWTRLFLIRSKWLDLSANPEVQTWRWVEPSHLELELKSTSSEWVPGSSELLHSALSR